MKEYSLAVTGQIAVDTKNPNVRFAMNAMISVSDLEHNILLKAAISSHHPNSKSIGTSVTTAIADTTESSIENIQKNFDADVKHYTSRDRVVTDHIMELESGDINCILKCIQDFLANDRLKVSIKDSKRFYNKLQKKLTENIELTSKSFLERIEARIEAQEDYAEIEESLGIGKETASSNPNWGMF